MIIFLYQSVITMLQIKKLATNLKWNSIGKKLFTVLVVVSLRWPLTLPKARCACQGKRITGVVPAWALSPDFPSLPWNNLGEGVSARLDHCTTDTIKWCNLRWREENFCSPLSLLTLVQNGISPLLYLKPQQQFSKGGCGTVLAPWLYPEI